MMKGSVPFIIPHPPMLSISPAPPLGDHCKSGPSQKGSTSMAMSPPGGPPPPICIAPPPGCTCCCCCCCCPGASAFSPDPRLFRVNGPRTYVHLRPSFLHISHTTSLPWSLHWIFLLRHTSQGRCFLDLYLRPPSCC